MTQAQKVTDLEVIDNGALVAVDQINLAEVFNPDGAMKILAQIKERATSEVFDVSTFKGRKAIASMAYRVARSKTMLDEAGKEYVAEQKAIIKRVDSARKLLRDGLDELKSEVRAPLTKYEEEEAARKAEEERIERDRIASIQGKITNLFDPGMLQSLAGKSALQVYARIQSVTKIEILEDDYQEFTDQAQAAKETLIDQLNALYQAKTAQEEEAKRIAEEQAKLAAERAEIERQKAELAKEREAQERAKREAMEKAEAERRAKEEAERKEAEAKAAAEREEIERKEREEKEKAEAARQAELAPDVEKIFAFVISIDAHIANASESICFQSEDAASLFFGYLEELGQINSSMTAKLNNLKG